MTVRTALEVIADHDLTGREAIVTGGAAGLGFETARALAAAGARVVLAGRDQQVGAAAVAALRASTGNDRIVFRPLDLASLESVTTWAHKHAATGKPLHILILNAGIMATPLRRTADGVESQFAVNYLGHFALTMGLLPSLRAAGSARVVSLTSRAHRRGDIDFDDPNYLRRHYDPWQAYGQSKTACALLAVGLHARYAVEGLTANAVMPGGIVTGLQRHLDPEQLAAAGWPALRRRGDIPPGWRTPEQGAATSVWAAVAPGLVGGEYLEDCAVATAWNADGNPPPGYYLPYAVDPGRADRLWALAEQLAGVGRKP
ncbi:SDR family NAD(P)-dependent oxidoreductase [Nocardia sp. NPDC046473]|uniref:SDR family NAD(P)-dependent oxidoreductase n=1 Tax=Nocardia sp. NPDC046473 TaxID=3155733 RepID=UPI0033FBADD3